MDNYNFKLARKYKLLMKKEVNIYDEILCRKTYQEYLAHMKLSWTMENPDKVLTEKEWKWFKKQITYFHEKGVKKK